jgi:Peroxiredoxin
MLRTLKLIPGLILHRIRQALASGAPKMLSEGAKAPDFTIQDESGNEHSLTHYKGRRVLLWWFIRASTPG